MRPEISTIRPPAPTPLSKEQEAAILRLAEELGRLIGRHLAKIEQQATSSVKRPNSSSPPPPGS